MASVCITWGVIQPPHTLLRGNRALSSTTTFSPLDVRAQAHDDPAGPPPAIRISHESISSPEPALLRQYRGWTMSTAARCTCSRQRRLETIADRQHEKRQWSRPGTGATCAQTAVQTSPPRLDTIAQTC